MHCQQKRLVNDEITFAARIYLTVLSGKMDNVEEIIEGQIERERQGWINKSMQTADGTAITSEHREAFVNTLNSISSLGRAGYCVRVQ